jgi:hypothetical protein
VPVLVDAKRRAQAGLGLLGRAGEPVHLGPGHQDLGLQGGQALITCGQTDLYARA